MAVEEFKEDDTFHSGNTRKRRRKNGEEMMRTNEEDDEYDCSRMYRNEKCIYGVHTLKIKGVKAETDDSLRGASEDDVSLRELMYIPGIVWDEVVIENFMFDSVYLTTKSMQSDNDDDNGNAVGSFTLNFYKNHIKNLLLIHGEKNDESIIRGLRNVDLTNYSCFRPKLPIAYGTHHTKMILLASYGKDDSNSGIRIIIHTANLIQSDLEKKTQGVWCQDFPISKEYEFASTTHDFTSLKCDFAGTLDRYFKHMGFPKSSAYGNLRVNPRMMIRRFDFSKAAAKLIASVPGYHKACDDERDKWGHMSLRNALSSVSFETKFIKSGTSLSAQFSSIGSLDEKWLEEFKQSFGASSNLPPLANGRKGLHLIWPTVTQVRNSLEGYAAGLSIPGYHKNVIAKGFLQQYWHIWNTKQSSRKRAMPHIKSYARHSEDGECLWVLLTSANLSKAAWGCLQKNYSQLMIRSYEIGVLLLPCLIKHFGNWSFRIGLGTIESNEKTDDQDIEICKSIRLPHVLPPKPYMTCDQPWVVDAIYTDPDIFGRTYP